MEEKNNKSSNEQLEAVKRQLGELVAELRARKLLLPAVALLMAIVVAVIVLPRTSEVPAVSGTVAPPSVDQPKIETVAQISLLEPGEVGNGGTPLASSANPFVGDTGYVCQTISTGTPKVLICEVGDLKVRVACPPDASGSPCGEPDASGSSDATGGSTGGTGSSPGGGSGGSTDSGGSGEDKSGESEAKSTYYTVTVSIDGKTTKNVEAGTDLPKKSAALVVYAGPNDANNKAIFILSDGVTAEGVEVDETFGSFTLAKNKTVTLIDAKGVEHKMTLKSMKKVTK